MLRRHLALSGLSLVLFAGAPVALAQKADPPAAEVPMDELPDIAKLKYAYEKAGFPRVMVLVGKGTDEHQVIDPGSILANTDASAVSFKIKAAFEQVINDPAADLELVSINDLRAAIDRVKATLANTRDEEAASLIGKQAQAELLILIRLTKSDLPGAPFSVVFETSNPVRGRKGLTFAFDWKGDTTQPEINANAAAMARKFINDFAQRVSQPSKYTLRLFGLDSPEALRSALDAVRSIEGIKRVRSRSSSLMDDPFTGKQGSAAEYEATIDPAADSDHIVLLAAIAESLKQKLVGSEVLLRQTEGGMIAIKVVAKGAVRAASGQAAGLCESLFMARSPAGDAKRAELRSAYEAKGSPRIAVVVNRTLQPGSATTASTGVSTENLIVVTNSGSNLVLGAPTSTTPTEFYTPDRAEFQARQMERGLSERLSVNLVGLKNIVSADVAKAQLLSDKKQTEVAIPQAELIAVLQKASVADIVIFGTGKSVQEGSSVRITYTIEAVRMSDAVKLAFADATALMTGETESAVMSRLADEALGKLGCSLLASWR